MQYLTIFIYRLTLHPLAKIPGPLFARTTDWYNVYTAAAGDRHLDFYKLHMIYGPVVRYGPSRVSINSSSALHTIYNHKANVQKSSYYSIFNHYFKAPSVLTAITAKEHGRKRRIVSQGLSDSAIQAMEGHVLKNVRKFCSKLVCEDVFEKNVLSTRPEMFEEWGPPKNVTRWTNYLTFDIMGDLCFSQSFGMLDSVENHYMLEVLPAGVQGLNIIGHMQIIAALQLDKILFRDLARANARYEAFSKKQADERILKGDKLDTKDVFYFLQKGTDPETGEGFTLHELVSEASLLILGGTDTTATAISSTLFYILHNSTVLAKLNDEVRTAFSQVEEIRGGGKLSECRYLRACIDEALRMTPGVGGILPREVLPGGIVVDNTYFPAGIDIGVPIYALQHNEAYHSQPFEYIPERWLVNENVQTGLGSSESVALAKSAFCPFSLGSRGCVGKGMAYKELSIVLARLVYCFDMRIAPGTTAGEGNPSLGEEGLRHRKGEFQGLDKFVLKADGPMVEFKLRGGELL
ncbi:hypothetical protein MMC22_001113 [Lobaria immixta]|nr:hypothetical protein [Lobaria immixta]